MRNKTLLVFSAVLMAIAVGCTKENASENLTFAGIEVEVGEQNGSSMLFILNEGPFPGASTLDLLDFKTKKYYADVFGQTNPEVEQGMGNTGNDMALVDGRLWVLMNASNQVVVLDMPSCKLNTSISIESPRHLDMDENYVYITSYGGAVYGGDPTEGKVYRVNRRTFAFDFLQVGYQPEGVSVVADKLFVANSGGYNYTHDNRLTVIDLNQWKVLSQQEMPVTNLNEMKLAHGKLWMSSYGESTWTEETPGNWFQTISAPMSLVSVPITLAEAPTVVPGVHADKMTYCEPNLYVIGNDAEMTGGYDLCLYKVNTNTGTITTTHFEGSDLHQVGDPYGLLVNPANGDIYICDASFTGDSKVHCFNASLQWKWSVTTGIGTGHLLLR